jgi:hypothetical protein
MGSGDKPMSSAHFRVSLSLQGLAQYVDDFLKDRAGERVSYVLMVNVDNVTQYVSNTDRKDGTELVESLLARWKANRADIPAHYNPDLK